MTETDLDEHSRGSGTPRSWFAPVLSAVSFLMLLPLLRWAAKRDRHFHTNVGRFNDEIVRTGAGTFLLAGLIAASPAIVSLFIPSRRKLLPIAVIIVSALLAGVCELVVTIAPQPWFNF